MVLGWDMEKAHSGSGAAFSGTSTRNGDLLTLFCKNGPADATKLTLINHVEVIARISAAGCFGREKERRRCAHCGEDLGADPRSLLFYGTVTDFCDLQCQRRFVAEFFARPMDNDQHVPKKGKELAWPWVMCTDSAISMFPTC